MGPAPRTAGVVLVLTLLAVLAASFNQFPLFIRLLLAALVLTYGVTTAYRLLRPRLRAVVLHADGLGVVGKRGSGRDRVPVARCFVSPWYVGVGSWRSGLGLFREQMAPDDFRRLCVYLRQGQPR